MQFIPTLFSLKSVLLTTSFVFTSIVGAQVLTLQPDANLGKDAFINDYNTHVNLNFGSNDQFPAHAGTSSGASFVARGLIDFDLSSIPLGMKIDSAYLSLYAYNPSTQGNLGTHRNSSGSNAAWLRKITSSWSEMSVTWNSAPTTTSTNQVALPPSLNSTQDYLDINITPLIKDKYQNPLSNFGFQILLQNEAYYRTLNFYSSDATDSLKHPKLVVYYSPDTLNSIIIKPGANAGKDALIHELQSQRNLNFGLNNQFPAHAGTFSGTPFLSRGLIDFDLSVIPSGMKVDSAFLTLYAYDISNNGFGTHRNTSGSNAAWLRRITSTWGEMSVTWNNAPTTTTVNQVAVPASTNSTQNYQNINVTPLILDILANPNNSFGFQFILQNETHYRTLNFYSSDAMNSAFHPELQIFYSPIATSIENVSLLDENVTLFPNPANNTIQLNLNSNESNYQVSIFDVSGKVIQTIQNYKSTQPISINTFASGIYFATISTEREVKTKKFIVQ